MPREDGTAAPGTGSTIQVASGRFLSRTVWRRFKRSKINLVALSFIAFLVLTALLADIIAYNKPLVCKREGVLYFPVFADYLAKAGLYHWDMDKLNEDWKTATYQWAIWPPVRYLPNDIDYRNQRLLNPFGKQDVATWGERHFLGTERDGRDVLSGLVHGTRVSLTIGLLAVGIAGIIGIFLGAVAGYFGDTRIQLSTAGICMGGIGLVLGYFYGFQVRAYTLRDAMAAGSLSILFHFLVSMAIFVAIPLLLVWCSRVFHRVPVLGKRREVWLDMMISRLIELFMTIPTLLLVITLMAMTEEKSIFFLIAIFGLLGWPNVARNMRTEMLRTRSQEFIESARALGYSHFRIMVRHAIPNCMSPVMVVLTFGVASTIVAEAALSFLGIGVPDDVMTWGGLLYSAKSNGSAWWLSVFPGMAIFLTATSLNLVGEGIRDALDPRVQYEK